MQVSCRSEQTCRTSCSSTGRMLRHGGAPIWSGLTVKTGENGPNYRDFFSDWKFWPRTHPNLKADMPRLNWTRHFPDAMGRSNAPSCRSQIVDLSMCKSHSDPSSPCLVTSLTPAACRRHTGAPIENGFTNKIGPDYRKI